MLGGKEKGRLAGLAGGKEEMGWAKREREGEKEKHPNALEFEFEI
jgi:hypothetical protein